MGLIMTMVMFHPDDEESINQASDQVDMLHAINSFYDAVKTHGVETVVQNLPGELKSRLELHFNPQLKNKKDVCVLCV